MLSIEGKLKLLILCRGDNARQLKKKYINKNWNELFLILVIGQSFLRTIDHGYFSEDVFKILKYTRSCEYSCARMMKISSFSKYCIVY